MSLSNSHTSQRVKQARIDADHARQLYKQATQPVDYPHESTLREARALELFGETECAYTPHLLDFASDYMLDGVDDDSMPGGYVVFILMNKVPGEQLDWDLFWDKEEATREEIRRAFKTALK